MTCKVHVKVNGDRRKVPWLSNGLINSCVIRAWYVCPPTAVKSEKLQNGKCEDGQNGKRAYFDQ
jgi:hypothetical protein